MADQFTVLVQAAIAGGPSTSASHSLQLTAYDRVSITLEGTDKDDPTKPVSDPANNNVPSIEVEVQPTSATERVAVLAITSDRYSVDLVYSVDGGAEDIGLDHAHVFIGAGAIALLKAAPKKLTFRNGMGAGQSANITILAGRQATA
jgi:hypothetical protein